MQLYHDRGIKIISLSRKSSNDKNIIYVWLQKVNAVTAENRSLERRSRPLRPPALHAPNTADRPTNVYRGVRHLASISMVISKTHADSTSTTGERAECSRVNEKYYEANAWVVQRLLDVDETSSSRTFGLSRMMTKSVFVSPINLEYNIIFKRITFFFFFS